MAAVLTCRFQITQCAAPGGEVTTSLASTAFSLASKYCSSLMIACGVGEARRSAMLARSCCRRATPAAVRLTLPVLANTHCSATAMAVHPKLLVSVAVAVSACVGEAWLSSTNWKATAIVLQTSVLVMAQFVLVAVAWLMAATGPDTDLVCQARSVAHPGMTAPAAEAVLTTAFKTGEAEAGEAMATRESKVAVAVRTVWLRVRVLMVTELSVPRKPT